MLIILNGTGYSGKINGFASWARIPLYPITGYLIDRNSSRIFLFNSGRVLAVDEASYPWTLNLETSIIQGLKIDSTDLSLTIIRRDKIHAENVRVNKHTGQLLS
jgi:hypothetical protein